MYHLSQYPENTFPQGKHKIFFCCHPKDLVYLPDPAREILQYADCVICYLDDQTGDGLPASK